ncbi:MAG: hypothetical protein IJY38_02305 [Clostridia bacterium]|nr:hypothetical protein [Clostridia bacterium]
MQEKKFEFNYSAPTEKERREIECIRRQYEEKVGEDKLTKIRKLDAKVRNTAFILALSLGVIGTLVFGLGLTMVLEWDILLWGSVVAFLGIPLIVAAYPVYNAVLKKMKKKYKDEIIALSDELLK